VVFRGENGRAYALEGDCYHRGANLAQGKVEGSCITCPYHLWTYDGESGRCVAVGLNRRREIEGFMKAIEISQFKLPEAAKQVKYPLVEKDGVIWVFSDTHAYFPPPQVSWANCSDYYLYRAKTLTVQCHSTHVVENIVDIQHLIAVHKGRGVYDKLAVEEAAPHELRCRYRLGTPKKDRLFTWLLGGEDFGLDIILTGPNNVHFDITRGSWYATMTWYLTDNPDGKSCRVTLMTYSKKGSPLAKPLNWILGYLTNKMNVRVTKEDIAIFNDCSWGVGQLHPEVDYGYKDLWAFLRKFDDPSNFGEEVGLKEAMPAQA